MSGSQETKRKNRARQAKRSKQNQVVKREGVGTLIDLSDKNGEVTTKKATTRTKGVIVGRDLSTKVAPSSEARSRSAAKKRPVGPPSTERTTELSTAVSPALTEPLADAKNGQAGTKSRRSAAKRTRAKTTEKSQPKRSQPKRSQPKRDEKSAKPVPAEVKKPVAVQEVITKSVEIQRPRETTAEIEETVDTSGQKYSKSSAKRKRWLTDQQRRVFAAVGLSLGLMSAGGGAAFATVESKPDMWGAEAVIILETNESQVDRFLETQIVLLESNAVLDHVSESSGIAIVDLKEDLSIQTVGAGIALELRYSNEDPTVALSVLEWILAHYQVEIRSKVSDIARVVYLQRIDELQTLRTATELELSVFEVANSRAVALELAPPNPTEQRRLTLESAQLLDQIAGLEQQLVGTSIQALSEVQVNVVSQPRLLEDRIGPTPIPAGVLGVLAGGVLAALCLFLIGRSRSAGKG